MNLTKSPTSHNSFAIHGNQLKMHSRTCQDGKTCYTRSIKVSAGLEFWSHTGKRLSTGQDALLRLSPCNRGVAIKPLCLMTWSFTSLVRVRLRGGSTEVAPRRGALNTRIVGAAASHVRNVRVRLLPHAALAGLVALGVRVILVV